MGTDAIRLRPSQIAAVTAGNALEFYDFVTYAFFATQIGHALFPGDASSKLLLSLATFGVGFLTRPLGGIVIGRKENDDVLKLPSVELEFQFSDSLRKCSLAAGGKADPR